MLKRGEMVAATVAGMRKELGLGKELGMGKGLGMASLALFPLTQKNTTMGGSVINLGREVSQDMMTHLGFCFVSIALSCSCGPDTLCQEVVPALDRLGLKTLANLR